MKLYLASIFFGGLIAFNLLHPATSIALAKFNTAYQIYYLVQPTGNTHVTYSIKQSNNLSVVYATDFGISINETKISNIKITDEGVPVKPDVIKTLNQTSISFPFANKVVGKNKVHSFTIEYDTSDITSKFGNTWQINIPRLEPDENVSEQTAILSVPEGFPEPAYIDPKPDIVNGNNYYFNSKVLSNKSISAIFGTTQYYKGKLVYHLANDGQDKVRTEIAIPPDTAYQSIYIEKIDPKPETIVQDEDGNLLAKFVLGAKQNLEVIVDIYFKINFHPIPIAASQAPDKYLTSNQVWNYDNNVFTSTELNNLKTAKSIYDFVSDKMNYDYEKIYKKNTGLVAASESLKNNTSAICTDFTNVYVALARKAGIPAREIEGYAVSDNPDLKPKSLNQDVLHAWPEYYDSAKNTWIQIDPTWTNTTRGVDYFNKLDFNHITFVIHGQNPIYPVPAGGYKNGSAKTRDVYIEPIAAMDFPKPEISIRMLKQDKDSLIFQINNSSGVTLAGVASVIKNEFVGEGSQTINVPPMGSKELTVKIDKSPFISKNNVQVIININGERYEQSVTIVSTGSQIILLAGVGGILGLTSVLAWGLHLRRQGQRTSVYR
jgi:hypothetical protein